jgi:hypothetical protein
MELLAAVQIAINEVSRWDSKQNPFDRIGIDKADPAISSGTNALPYSWNRNVADSHGNANQKKRH